MSSPNPQTPEGMLDGLGGIAAWSQKTQAEWEAEMRGRLTGSTTGIADFAIDLMRKFGKFLADVAHGIGQGLLAAGGFVMGVLETIGDAIGSLIGNLAAAILGKPPAEVEDYLGPGALAAIEGGQRELIGNIAALKDSAGFCNLTMSEDWDIRGNKNQWIPVQFDHLVTQPKNAVPHGARWTGGALTGLATIPGIMLLAPGVWHIQPRVTAWPEETTYQYGEVEVTVYRMMRFRNSATSPWTESQLMTWDRAWFPMQSTKADYTGPAAFVPVLIPEFEVHVRDGAGNVLQEDVGFKVTVSARFRDSARWHLVGGTLRSSLSVTRMSVDTTDYSPPSTGTGTVVIADGTAP